jgi:hypothetical protein
MTNQKRNKSGSGSFIVYYRKGNRLHAYSATLVGGGADIQVGADIAWSSIYKGHCQKVADLIEQRNERIAAARAKAVGS